MKICSLYGAGFYYMPGTDTCLKVGGFVRAEMNFNAGGSYNPYRAANFDSPGQDFEHTRARWGITADARTQTQFGTLRSYLLIAPTHTDGGANPTPGGTPYIPVFANAGFIQLAGFTAGVTGSFFDFDTQPYSNLTPWWSSNQSGNGIAVFAYTAQFGNGWSATISAEDTTSRRSGVVGVAYQGRTWPDVVGNLRVDQAWGGAQVMGAVHNASTFTVATGATQDNTGWAFGLGVKLNAPMFGKGDYFLGQVTFAKGATNYLLVNSGAGGAGAFALARGYPVITSFASGPVFDSVGYACGGAVCADMSSGWDITAGYEHNWVPNWKTSLYGSYGELKYSDAASTALGGSATNKADWSAYQIGSRTTWTIVPNLDLSLELTYNKLNTAFPNSGAPFSNLDFVSGMFRVQRNFYP